MREIVSDVLLYEKTASGFWEKKRRDLMDFDCEILLSIPVCVRKGDVYEWEMIEC